MTNPFYYAGEYTYSGAFQFYWDGQAISTARAQLDGTGLNISFLIFHQAVYFDPRRNQR